VALVSSFEKYESVQSFTTVATNSKRTDRMFKKIIFCPNESCINTFESEDDLNVHILLNQHTTKESSLRLQDKTKLMLFERLKNNNMSSSTLQPTATTATTNTSSIDVPRHTKFFQAQGWALRIRKPCKPIHKDVKEFIKSIFEQEKVYGKIYIDSNS